jgi:chitinase
VHLVSALPAALTFTDDTGEGLIDDDDNPPTVSIDNVAVIEGNAGTTMAVFDVTLSNISERGNVTADVSTSPGTATAAVDYQHTALTLTFEPGEIVKTFQVPVNGDTDIEDAETFFATITSTTQSSIGTAVGSATIADDDGTPTITLSNAAAVAEGNPSLFDVTLSPASDQTVTVNWFTVNHTAVANGDYQADSGTFTFTPGDTI